MPLTPQSLRRLQVQLKAIRGRGACTIRPRRQMHGGAGDPAGLGAVTYREGCVEQEPLPLREGPEALLPGPEVRSLWMEPVVSHVPGSPRPEDIGSLCSGEGIAAFVGAHGGLGSGTFLVPMDGEGNPLGLANLDTSPYAGEPSQAARAVFAAVSTGADSAAVVRYRPQGGATLEESDMAQALHVKGALEVYDVRLSGLWGVGADSVVGLKDMIEAQMATQKAATTRLEF